MTAMKAAGIFKKKKRAKILARIERYASVVNDDE